MPWRNNGDFYSFKTDSIGQHAPSLSGVYGLFNLRHQIVIGNAANIRDALLHHRQHSNFRFRRFEPTGFTFEICPPERREQRAQELIAEFAPIMPPQGSIGVAALWRSWRAPAARAFKVEAIEKKPLDDKAPATELPRRETEPPAYLNPERFGLAGAVCGIIFLAIGMIGLVPHLKKMFDSVVRNPTASAQSRQKTDDRAMPAEQTASPAASAHSEPTAAVNGADQGQVKPAGGAPAGAVATVATTPQTQAAKQPTVANPWSVQLLATADQQLANDWLNKLKAKGYEAFVVVAEVKGQTWHRLRIGNFATRQEAEALRLALQAKEGFRDAYIAGNEQSSTTLAFNRR